MEIVDKLRSYATKERKEQVKKFHKIDNGGYAASDMFLGVYVPDIRKLAKEEYRNITMEGVQALLYSQYHEERLFAVILLQYKYEKANKDGKEQIVSFYLNNSKYINGWDLVDLTAPSIVGRYVFENNKSYLLEELSKSCSIWDRRIAIVSNLYLIKKGKFDCVLDIIKDNSNEKEDLIQKAMGWMLREVGKVDYLAEYDFLKAYYKQMPRVTLRYSIERFNKEERIRFLKGEI